MISISLRNCHLFSLSLFLLTLCGCFQNLSSNVSSSKNSVGQTNSRSPAVFTDVANATPLSIEGSVVSTYRSITNPSQFGIILNIEKALTTLLTPAGVSDLAANSANRSVDDKITIRVPSFHLEISFPIRKLAENKKIRNIVHLLPGLTRIDFTSGYSQEAAPAIQLPIASFPIALFGGSISNTPVNFLSVFYFDGINQLPGFLPKTRGDTFGMNFPGDAPIDIIPELVPVTPAIARIFKNIFRNPTDGSLNVPGGESLKAHFQGVDGASPGNYFVSVYRRNQQIVQARINYLNSAGVKGSEDQFKFCDIFYDDDDNHLYLTWNGKQYVGRNPFACDCIGAEPLPVEIDKFYRKADACNGENNKVTALNAAIAAKPSGSYFRVPHVFVYSNRRCGGFP